jgi:hypothetical protein
MAEGSAVFHHDLKWLGFEPSRRLRNQVVTCLNQHRVASMTVDEAILDAVFGRSGVGCGLSDTPTNQPFSLT